MKRRTFFERLAEWAAALGFSGAAAAVSLPARENPPHRGSGTRHEPLPEDVLVHWVSLDRRHIEARLVRLTETGVAAIRVIQRPPVRLMHGGVVTSEQIIEGVRFFPMPSTRAPGQSYAGPVANSWHYPEPDGETRPARPYAEWWYRRSPTDGHGELTPKPAPWLIKAEGREPHLIQPQVEADGLLAYRLDSEGLRAGTKRHLEGCLKEALEPGLRRCFGSDTAEKADWIAHLQREMAKLEQP